MEARKAAKKQFAGSGVANAINPVRGYRDALVRKGLTPKDHHKENMEALREAQKFNREIKAEEEEQKDTHAFVMDKFKDVESRIGALKNIEDHQDHFEKTMQKLSDERSKKVFEAEKKPAASQKYTRRFPPLPKDEGKLLHTEGRNFIEENAKDAVTMPPPEEEEDVSAPFRHEYQGKVPDYLEERKMELDLAKEQARQEEEARNAQTGMTLVSESDRMKTLEVLIANRLKIEEELRRMPLVRDLPSLVEKENLLHAKLKEIEDAIKTFSRKKVYLSDS